MGADELVDRVLLLLRERLSELSELRPPAGSQDFLDWRQKTIFTLDEIFGSWHDYTQQFKGISFSTKSDEPDRQVRAFELGVSRAKALLKGMMYYVDEVAGLGKVDSSLRISIDPDLWEHVRRLIDQEQWDHAARETTAFVESKIRQWAGLPPSKYGQDLMATVLRPGGGIFPLGQTPAEQQGWLSFGIGFATGVGNATRHRIQQRDDDERYAMGVLGAGSLLLTQLRYEHGDDLRS